MALTREDNCVETEEIYIKYKLLYLFQNMKNISMQLGWVGAKVKLDFEMEA